MNRLINDLDNALGMDESYSYLVRGTNPDSESSNDSEYAPIPINPVRNPYDNGGYISEPRPIGTGNVDPLPPRDNGEDDVITSKPISTDTDGFEDEGMLGGYGGGGGGGAMAEEEIEMEGLARIDEDKILGLEPLYFYGLLLLAAGGSFYYYRTKIAK